VHKHLEHLYRKLSVQDRMTAVRHAQEVGLLVYAKNPADS
jgi:ATP/maltotriose-dependent transcriptional regulator MalT